MVQIGVIGVLLVVAALMLMIGPMKKKDDAAVTDPATSTTSAELTSPSGTVEVTAEVTPAPGAAAGVPGAPVGPTTIPPEALAPGPGLPADVVSAWKDGNAIVLLVVRTGSVDDRLVRSSVASLSSDPNVSVFVAPARNVARYSRITQGVGVNRVPALVVIRPQRLSGDSPEAVVSYGFRGSKSVVQAVDDALYSGKDNRPYHPG